MRRFEALGGVRLDPADPLRTFAEIGVAETGQRFRFRCPTCLNEVVNDQEMEPICTGPSWRDEHPHEVMERIAG